MSKQDEDVDAHGQKREALAPSGAPRDGARPKVDGRAWPLSHRLPLGRGKVDARRQVPNGPLGGSGRKTNRSRSS